MLFRSAVFIILDSGSSSSFHFYPFTSSWRANSQTQTQSVSDFPGAYDLFPFCFHPFLQMRQLTRGPDSLLFGGVDVAATCIWFSVLNLKVSIGQFVLRSYLPMSSLHDGSLQGLFIWKEVYLHNLSAIIHATGEAINTLQYAITKPRCNDCAKAWPISGNNMSNSYTFKSNQPYLSETLPSDDLFVFAGPKLHCMMVKRFLWNPSSTCSSVFRVVSM